MADENIIAPEVEAPVVEAAPEAAPQVEALVTPAPSVVENIQSEPADDTGIITYDPTGDPGLDVALSFLGSLGLGADNAGITAAAKGNFTILEATLASLGDKAQGWQQMLALAKQAYTNSEAKQVAHTKSIDTAILSVVQSADNWDAIKAWAAKNADPAEKAEINRMVDAGPVQARAAATLLLEAYRKATGTVITPANATGNASGIPAANASGTLTSRQYAEEVATLRRTLGTRMEGSQQYRALQSRLAR